jgi:hypothetical protein
MTKDQIFCDLLERCDLSPDEELELTRLSRELDERDRYLDAQIRQAFRDLEGDMVWLH